MGKFLSRHPRTVYDAVAEAQELGLIKTEVRNGLSASRSPVVCRAIAEDPTASTTWTVEAVAGLRPKAGRPRKTPAPYGQGFSEKPLPPEDKNPCPTGAHNFTKRDFTKECGAAPPLHTPKRLPENSETISRAGAPGRRPTSTLPRPRSRRRPPSSEVITSPAGRGPRIGTLSFGIGWPPTSTKKSSNNNLRPARSRPLELQRSWLEALELLGPGGMAEGGGSPAGRA